MREIECESRIVHVDVFARGAVVTRNVIFPSELPSEEANLVVSGITALAQPGTARARISGERTIVYVRSRAVVSRDVPVPGEVIERLRELERAWERVDLERRYLQARRAALGELKPEPKLDVRWRRIDPAARVSDALAALSLADELTSELDRRLIEIDDARVDLSKRLERTRLEAAQAGSAERTGEGRETSAVVVHLGAGARPEALQISYAVPAARWWPVYSARFASPEAGAPESSGHALWTLEAFVVQATGEDWHGVRLSLSTAGLVRDAQLPELLSYRLGRKQPPARRAFRPLPEGLGDMFAGYDEALARSPPPAAPLRTTRPDSRIARARAGARQLAAKHRAANLDNEFATSAAGDAVVAAVAVPASAPEPMQLRAPMPSAAPMAARSASYMMAAVEDLPTAVGYPSSSEVSPADAWLDFDALVLSGMEDQATRGRLVKEPSPPFDEAGDADRVELVPLPRYACDPHHMDERGPQVRYDAEAPVEIASDTLPHRVLVASASGRAAPTLVVLPRESTDVYREAVQKNPFAVTLLSGPTDVFLDGALLTTSALELTGEGGTLRLGLGVEERIRVVRNVRVQEESAGFLGGKTAVQHDVSIELASSLGYSAKIRVYDRVPVTEDREVEIELLAAHPRPEKYDQADRGAPVRGGLVWELEIGAGARERVEFSYRIMFPGKSELEGGNRRE